MSEEKLLNKPANGETLVAFYSMIQTWVQMKLDALDLGGITEESVRAMLEEIVEGYNVPTEEEIQNIINNAIDSTNALTEKRVQEMIDESVGKIINAAY